MIFLKCVHFHYTHMSVHNGHYAELNIITLFFIQKVRCPLGRGMLQDLQRRIPHYFSDFKDGKTCPKWL